MRGSITTSCSAFRRLLLLTIHRVAEHHADRIAQALAEDRGICLQVAKEAERCSQELGIPATRCCGEVWHDGQLVLAEHHWLSLGDDVILDSYGADTIRAFRTSECTGDYRAET